MSFRPLAITVPPARRVAPSPHRSRVAPRRAARLNHGVRDRDGGKANDARSEPLPVLLKSGYPLTAKVEMLELAGKKVFSIAETALLVCMEKALTVEVIRTMAEQRPEPVICLDAGFAGSDQLIAELPDPRRRVSRLIRRRCR